MADLFRFEDTRYNRQELIPQLGSEGQLRLGRASVAVIGAGGVKSSLLYYLVAAGIGRIRIVDFDSVELSNLNRQILFSQNDIGRNKAEAARDRLLALNPEVEIESVPFRLSEGNVDELLRGFDVVVEGGDSTDTRQLVNKHCVDTAVPMVHASAQYNYGYAFTVFPHRTSCFNCIFPDLPEGHGGSVPVFGIATGLAGIIGAGEVVKIVTGVGRPICNGMLSFSGFLSDFIFVPSPRRSDCRICGNAS